MSERLDKYLAKSKHFTSRSKASEAIADGIVAVNDEIEKKSSYMVEDGDKVEVVGESLKYVSRAGLKLEKAIEHFGIDFSGKVILDIGASTGGFTDCALQHGAKKVFACDVGSGQLASKLIADNRVVNLEKTNAVDLKEEYFEQADFIVCDVSFVSGVLVLQKIAKKIKAGTRIVWLVKPQFECGKRLASKYKGVITNENLALQVAQNSVFTLKVFDYEELGFVKSPIKGGDGNTEFLAYVKKK